MEWVWVLLAAPFIGSLLGVLIMRLPEGRPIALARSACGHCGHAIMPRDLIPLFSHMALHGRCRHCNGSIAPIHWQVELAAVAVAASAVAAGPSAPYIWIDCGLGWTLLALAWIDCRTMLLPDVLTLPLIAAGLLVTFGIDPMLLTDHAMAAALGYTAFRGLALAYRRLRHRDGLGQGDAKLLAALGSWIGLAEMPFVVLVAALAGITAALVMRLSGRRLEAATAIPFGPCLALAGWLVWLRH